MTAWLVLAAGVVVWLAAFGQRLVASERRREALACYDQAEALVQLAVRYREAGDAAYDESRSVIADFRSTIEEWSV